MIRKIALFSLAIGFASAILLISVLRTASVKYVFSQAPVVQIPGGDKEKTIEINYPLVYPGRVLPDSFLWPIKVIRDKVWLIITTNPLKKAEILLLFADKRLGSAELLLKKEKSELAVSTLTKAEKYLEQAVNQEQKTRKKGIETGQFLERLALATLKHRQIIEENILYLCPEDAKQIVVQVNDYPKRLFQKVKTALIEVGRPIPESPFVGQN